MPVAVAGIADGSILKSVGMKCAGRLQIEGTVLGDIKMGHLVISDGVVVQSEIDAQEVEISGTLTGLVRAREITLKTTALVVGDLYQEVLAIDPGAQLEGQCHRLTNESESSVPPHPEAARGDLSILDRPQLTKELLRGVA